MPTDRAREALASVWFDRFARLGYAAKGIVFGVVGLLAIRVALGERQEEADFPGAIGEISEQPLQVVFLILLAFGLAGYSLWRITQGLADLEREGSDLRGWIKRLVYVGVGITYAGFAIYAIGIMAGWSTENEDGIRDITAAVLGWPFGEWLVGGAGVVVIIAGLLQIFFAISRRFEVELGRDDFGRLERFALIGAGGFGHFARGAVYGAAGFFAIRAAVDFDPDEARGLAETFQELASQPYGPFVVGTGGAGFVAFGLYCALLAFHRHIPNEGLIRGRRRRAEGREGHEGKGR
jgi:hypothetical protein